MKHLILATALCMFTTPALAYHCPADMAEIDKALESANLSEADMAKVKKLRAEGAAQHAGGDHVNSVDTLAKAKAILGID